MKKICKKCKQICEGQEGQSYLEMTGVAIKDGKVDSNGIVIGYWHISCTGKEMPNER